MQHYVIVSDRLVSRATSSQTLWTPISSRVHPYASMSLRCRFRQQSGRVSMVMPTHLVLLRSEYLPEEVVSSLLISFPVITMSSQPTICKLIQSFFSARNWTLKIYKVHLCTLHAGIIWQTSVAHCEVAWLISQTVSENPTVRRR